MARRVPILRRPTQAAIVLPLVGWILFGRGRRTGASGGQSAIVALNPRSTCNHHAPPPEKHGEPEGSPRRKARKNCSSLHRGDGAGCHRDRASPRFALPGRLAGRLRNRCGSYGRNGRRHRSGGSGRGQSDGGRRRDGTREIRFSTHVYVDECPGGRPRSRIVHASARSKA